MVTRPKKSPAPRARRKSVTIDVEAAKVVETDIAQSSEALDAEPVAFVEDETIVAPKPSVDSEDAPVHGEIGPGPEVVVRQALKASSGSNIVSGVVGGIVALVCAAGLQWTGAIPNMSPTSQDLMAIEARIDAVDARIVSAQEASNNSDDLGVLTGRINEIAQVSQSNVDAIGAVSGHLSEVSTSIEQLNDAFEGEQTGGGAGLEALTNRIAALEVEIDRLPADSLGGFDLASITARLEALNSQLGTNFTSTGQTAEALAIFQIETTQTVDALKVELETLAGDVSMLQDRVTAGGVNSTAVARAFAASSLKNAIDRGGAFGTELEAFAVVAQEVDSQAIATLRNFASGGVPTLSQLVDNYPAVANAIIASEQTLDSNASVGQRLLNNMRGLVSVRPVNEQTGSTPTAISTRIGARLLEADLAAALNEWEALPDAARAASRDFVDQLRARETVDGLLSKILTGAMSGTVAVDQ